MVRRYSRASTLFFDRPLALLPSKRDELVAFWGSKLAGAAIDWDEHQEPFQARTFAASGESGQARSVAVIPILGVLSQRMNLMSAMSGGTSTEELTQVFREQLNNPDVSAIVFDIDSPGGSTDGITELAQIIMEARGTKPIAAVANPLSASAGYWLGAAADHFFAEPSAMVGSIGVYAVHEDISERTSAEGINVTFVSAGKNKLRGNPYQPLSEADVAHIQTLVDDAYGMFIRDVARGRRVSQASVRNGFGQGDVVTASRAFDMGMIDGVQTLEQVIAMAPKLRPRKPGSMSASSIVTWDRDVVEPPAEGIAEPEEPANTEGKKLLGLLRWKDQQEKAALVAPGR